jgi:hypothetical protein
LRGEIKYEFLLAFCVPNANCKLPECQCRANSKNQHPPKTLTSEAGGNAANAGNGTETINKSMSMAPIGEWR